MRKMGNAIRDAVDNLRHGSDRSREYTDMLKKLGITKIQYACGKHPLGEGWVNVDREKAYSDSAKLFMRVDLTRKHPFPSDYFTFAFTEDFIEHLTQDESIVFLSEAFRCLKKGGVLRISSPGLKGVLRKHFQSGDYEGAAKGQAEAYTGWEHKHFYLDESLAVVARHIGFSDVKAVPYGESAHEALRGLDYRDGQREINIYAELTK
jgi:predicted SAM-dependent methyltransferase